MSVTDHRVGELVRQRLDSLSPAERRLARALLASYPIAGLESVARFAERAGVSPPTVTRFIAKLGFRGYPEFQENLRDEVQARLSSPLERYREEPKRESAVKTALDVATHNLKATIELLSDRDVVETVELLADVRRRVLVLGGRVSAPLARYLAAQLHLLRPGIGLVDAERSAPAQQLIDMRRTDLLVVFDYRRYQPDTIDCARVAAARGCDVGLFTDPWLSPALACARQVLVSGSTVMPQTGSVTNVTGEISTPAGFVPRLRRAATTSARTSSAISSCVPPRPLPAGVRTLARVCSPRPRRSNSPLTAAARRVLAMRLTSTFG